MSDGPSLDPFVEALRGELEQRARASAPLLDVADVLARAEAMDPERVPEGLRESLPMEEAHDEPEREEPGLSPFVEALRERHERVLHERSHAPIPAPPALDHRRRGLVVLVAVAAAVLLALAIGTSLTSVQSEREDETAAMEAERSQQVRDSGGRALERERSWAPSIHRSPGDASEAEAGEVDAETGEAEAGEVDAGEVDAGKPEAIEETEASGASTGHQEPSAGRVPVRSGVSTSTLEAEAREAWGRGNLGQAERLFRIIVRREGHSSRAELAYGDLFSLVRQRRGAAGQAKVWREYLRRFPRGRFAQDARAGLCRREPADAQARCWQRYLDAHPRGAHASEARAAVSKADP